MKLKWLGHACFLITSKDGLRVITDPYTVGGGIEYSPINEATDAVTVSHDHGDHNNISAVQGRPEVIKGSGKKAVKGIEFTGVVTFHDASGGQQRGPNTVFCFILDGIRICHLGDLGHLLTLAQVTEIGAVDLLLIPVGGYFTIDAIVANQVCDQLKPKIVIPMHFKTPKCGYPIAGVEDFIKGKKHVRKATGSEMEFEREKLPTATEIVLLHPAL